MARPRALDLLSLDQTLSLLPGARSAAEISGHLTALHSAPTYVPQEEWLARVLGEGYDKREGADEAVELVFALYQEIHARLSRGAPLNIPEDPQGLRDWASGYLDAVDLDDTWVMDSPATRLSDLIADLLELLTDPTDTDQPDHHHDHHHQRGDLGEGYAADNLLHLSAPHVALVTDELPDDDHHDDRGEAVEKLTRDALVDIAEEIADYARLAHVYWREARGKRLPDAQPLLPSPKPARAAAKVPRNAACPCGSGKKYKLCCGTDA